MHYLIYLGHPAHFHLFKNTIRSLKKKGHKLSVLIKKKDVLEELLLNSGMSFHNILPEGRKDNKAGIAIGVLKRDYRLLKYCLSNRPNVLIGTSNEIGHVGSILRIPSINVNEDDADAVPLYSKVSYPLSTVILSPKVCNNGKWEKKSVKYDSYHELAYLHPNHFKASIDIAKKYISTEKPYFLIRFAKLKAHHDFGISGISNEIAYRIVDLLKPHGNIYITAERPLDPAFEQYRLKIKPQDIHHVMAYASIYIGDSQTMAAESGVLGVPFIRFNDFAGKLGYLNELEEKYKLGYSIKPEKPEKLYYKIEELLKMPNREKVFQDRKSIMLEEKIDYAMFLSWFIENYPQSLKTIKETPDYQYNFKH